MAIGNPWGAAAQSYGQDLDQLTKIQMGGMQQAAQMPLQLYDRFMDGYEKARQRAAQEKQLEMQQAQLERQTRIAEDNAIHQRQQDLVARDRLTQQDAIAARKEAMDYEATFNARIPGAKERLTSLLQAAKMPTSGIPEVETAPNGGMELPGPVRPGEGRLVVQGENPLSGYGPMAYANKEEEQRKAQRDIDLRVAAANADSRGRMEIERKEKKDEQNQKNILATLNASLGKGVVEKTEDGLMLVDPRTGKARRVVDESGKPVKGPKAAGSSRERVTAVKDLVVFDELIRLVNETEAELDKHPKAVGPFRDLPGKPGELLNQVADPGGIRARALLSDLKSSRLKQRIGGAQTKIELQNLLAMVPSQGDWSAAETKKKLAAMKEAALAQRENVKTRYNIGDDERPEDDTPPGTKRFRVGKTTYNIPAREVDEFKRDNPTAQEL